MSETVYRKVGKRYVPFGIEGRPWDGIGFGKYVLIVDQNVTSIRRLPDVHLGFAEAALADLEEMLMRTSVEWLTKGERFSAADLASKTVAAVREFLQNGVPTSDLGRGDW